MLLSFYLTIDLYHWWRSIPSRSSIYARWSANLISSINKSCQLIETSQVDISILLLMEKKTIVSLFFVRFNKKKGFFCPINSNNRTQCLGNSKGRRYESMSSFAREYLNKYYLLSNRKLLKILQNKNYSIPLWLSDK